MKRIFLTGMSGTGKSTVIDTLSAHGFHAVDLDEPGWSERGPDCDWVWREDRVRELLSRNDTGVLFLSGCTDRQGSFYPQFDHVVLLSAPAEVLLERLRIRGSNRFGKDPSELADILIDLATVEPLLRDGADVEIDTSAPLDEVVSQILRLVEK